MSEYRHEFIAGAEPLDTIPIATRHRSKATFERSKRLFDIIMTLAIAPLAIVVVAIAALLVRLDGGKAFYSQVRVGKNGELFTLWKLRSMHPGAARLLEDYLQQNPAALSEWNENQKLRHDPRVTRVGVVIRKYSIDELPQLLNVLLGQMSLVGPRPFMPEQRQHYPGSAYFGIRPGLTGLWQVSDRNGCPFAERAVHDSRYAATMSFKTDLVILIRTVAVVLHGTGC